MCGIAGLVAAPGGRAPPRELVEAMTASLAHRGPDGQTTWVEGPLGLGHRRLSIIDVAGGANPLFDAEGHVALVFNGEIYNHLELRAELEAAGRRPRTGSDGEVIVHGYLAWGLLGMLHRLRGMYAFALADRRSGEVHLARDPLGIKPLFYSERGWVDRDGRASATGLAFGSEVKAVLAALGQRPALNPRALLQSVCLGYPLAPHTMYSGVLSLAPGECATWSGGRLRLKRHHELVFEPGSEPEDPEALWAALSTAVKSHLMSEVPLGAFLSGGVDSSAVVAAMAELAGEVEAVTVGIQGRDGGQDEGREMDERPFARSVAAGLAGVRLHEEVAEADLLELLPRLAWHLEAPFADTSAAPTFLLCQAARRHVTVALSGDGGDENFAGYRRTRYDVLEERLRGMIPASLRQGLLAPLGRSWPRRPWIPRPLRAGSLLTNLGGDWLDGWLTSLCRIPEPRARTLLRPEWRPPAGLRADVEQHAFRVAGLDPLSRVLAMDFSTWLPDDILAKVDRMSMAHGLEVRVPLLDTDFVEYAARLPNSAKLGPDGGKQLLRRALRGRVPDSVLDRRKQGFHLPIANWLAGPARGRVDELLAEPHGPAFDLLDPKPLALAAAEHRAGAADRSTELWLLLVLDAFLRHGPGGQAP